MKTLIIFTTHFPYGEEFFLGPEIKYLSQAYERVFIQPRKLKNVEKAELPPNVTVLPPLIETSKIRSFSLKSMNFCKGITLLLSSSSLKGLCKELKGKNIKLKTKAILWFLKYFYFLSKKSVQKLLDQPAEQTNIYHFWCDELVLLSIYIFSPKNYKVSTRLHGFDLYEERATYHYIPFRSILSQSSVNLIFISKHGYDYFKKRYPKTKKCHISYLGVEDNKRSRSSSDGIFRVVSCSSLIPIKRVGSILDVIKELDFPIDWTHFGDGEQKHSLMEKAENNLPKHINYRFYGDIQNQKLLSYYQNEPVDLFLHLSSTEGLPKSIMEALASGIPVIATDAGGTSEIVDDSVGKILPVNFTVKEASTAIWNFYKYSDKEVFRTKSKQRWSECVDAKKNYQQLVLLLKNI